MEPKLRTLNPAQPKPYLAPKLTEVELRPEEAVLGICKNDSTTGPLQSTCTYGVGCLENAS